MKHYNGLRCYFILVVCAVGAGVCGCRPSRSLQRLQRLHPELFTHVAETKVHVTEGKTKDTVFYFHRQKDTVRIEGATIYREGETFRYYYTSPACTTRIESHSTTPIKYVPVPVDKTAKIVDNKTSSKGKNWIAWTAWAIAFMFGLGLLRKFVKPKQDANSK